MEQNPFFQTFIADFLQNYGEDSKQGNSITNLTGTPTHNVSIIQDLNRMSMFAGALTGTFTLTSSVLTPPVKQEIKQINGGPSIVFPGVLFVDNNGTLTTIRQNNDGTFTLPNATITSGFYRFLGASWRF